LLGYVSIVRSGGYSLAVAVTNCDLNSDRHMQRFQLVFEAIKELTKEKAVPKKRRIGFGSNRET